MGNRRVTKGNNGPVVLKVQSPDQLHQPSWALVRNVVSGPSTPADAESGVGPGPCPPGNVHAYSDL